MNAVRFEPLRESAQQVLIEAHLAEGNYVEALRAFQAYARLARRRARDRAQPGAHGPGAAADRAGCTGNDAGRVPRRAAGGGGTRPPLMRVRTGHR